MRMILIFVLLILMLFQIAVPVMAQDQGWSFKPFEMKDSYTEDNEGYFTANWGAELNAPCGLFEFLGSGNTSKGESKYALEYSNELGAWFFNLWGKIDSKDTSTLYDNGLKFRWDNETFFGGASLESLRREPEKLDYRYGYKGWESQANWGWLTRNGIRFKMKLDRKMLDYFQTDDSSDKLHLESSLNGKIGDSYWSVKWMEWTYDYPGNPWDNLWGTQGELSWSRRFERQYIRIKLTGRRRERGDGLVDDYEKLEWGETYYFESDRLTIKFYLARQAGESWIVDTYDINKVQEEDWAIDTESGWGSDFTFRKELGLHCTWKFGGYYHENDGDGSLGLHTEWDCYLFDSWRLRFNLHGSASDDPEYSAGAWIMLTYYF